MSRITNSPTLITERGTLNIRYIPRQRTADNWEFIQPIQYESHAYDYNSGETDILSMPGYLAYDAEALYKEISHSRQYKGIFIDQVQLLQGGVIKGDGKIVDHFLVKASS